MFHYQFTAPVGLEQARSYIEALCKRARIYQQGVHPPATVIRMDAGEGRSTLARYITDLYREHQVLDFYSDLYECLEYELDGTRDQLHQVLEEIRSATVYANHLVFLDISKLAQRMCEVQYTEFLTALPELCSKDCIFFFVPAQPSAAESRMIRGIAEKIHFLEQISTLPYTREELGCILVRMLEGYGVQVAGGDRFQDVLSELLAEEEVSRAAELPPLLQQLMFAVNYQSTPTLGAQELSALLCEKKKEACSHEQK